jgi:phage regulator Rha-like protein
MVVMGLTGAEAARWKVRYIEAFNAMESHLRESVASQIRATLTKLQDEITATQELMFELAERTPRAKPPWIDHYAAARRAERKARLNANGTTP